MFKVKSIQNNLCMLSYGLQACLQYHMKERSFVSFLVHVFL